MKSNIQRVLLPLLLLSASAFAQGASPAATPAPQTKIGMISIQDAILATNEGQRDFQSLQKKFEPKQTELANLNKEIDDLKKQLSTQGDKMNDDARNTLVKNIETRQKNLQRSFEDAQNDYQTQQNELAQRIGVKLMDVVDKYAKQNNYTMILDVSSPQSPVVWAGPSTNITKDVVDLYNTQSGIPAPPSSAGTAKPPAAGAKPTPGGGAASSAKPAAPTTASPKPATPTKPQ
ncbi:MAG TPA: OmpH family outer membrane protein [Terriglobales bacterium]|nr:OmpH family outer membrane protein [Terriglobales bacterium]